jgi:cell division protein FtsI (penicillin-binding protein 3)
MFDPIAIELPETGRPLAPKQWREINTLTVAFGHGIAVTPLHLINGFATIVNGGVRRAPTLLKRDLDAPIDGTQVIRPETSAIMRRLLHLVVTDGTGKQAAAAGYLVGGKTGTAEKAVAGRYVNNALLSTFVAAFPMNAPRYAVLAMLDEPRGNESTVGFASAGWTAAPVVGRVISRIAPLLGVEPVDEEIAPGRNGLVVRINGRSRQLASF